MHNIFILIAYLAFLAAPAFAQIPEPFQVGLADFYLAKDDGTGKAGEQVSGFYTTDVPIYCVVQLTSPGSAIVKMSLIVVSVPGIRPGTRVVSTTYTTKDSQDRVNFTGRPDGEWLAGRYRAEIYIGSTLAVSREFAVQHAVAPKPSVEGINRPKPFTKPRPARRIRGVRMDKRQKNAPTIVGAFSI